MTASSPDQEVALPVQATNTRPRFEVTADGRGTCSHAGVVLLAELSDRLGLTKELGRRANLGLRRPGGRPHPRRQGHRLLPAAPLPTPQDQANWRKAGSPDLSFGIPSAAKPPNPQSDEGDIAFKYAPNDLTMQQLANLPTDPAALAKDLTRRIDAVTGPTPDRDRVLFFTAGELLRTPVTPGARAALLEIMAGMRGAKLLGTMTDPIGRTGIGVTWPGKPSVYDRHGRPTGRHAGAYEVFVFDPATTQLLAILEDQPGSPKGSTTILASGWTDQIGRKP